jgi:hypothetical protein
MAPSRATFLSGSTAGQFQKPTIKLDACAFLTGTPKRERQIVAAKITFPTEGRCRYQIETSSDGLRRTLATDQTQTDSTDKARTDVFASATSGHLLRVTFAGKPAAAAEVEFPAGNFRLVDGTMNRTHDFTNH